MAISLVEAGKIKQVWRDVKTLDGLAEKYGLSGAEYRDLPNAVAEQIEVGGAFVDPPIVEMPPRPETPEHAAIKLLAAELTAEKRDAVLAKLGGA